MAAAEPANLDGARAFEVEVNGRRFRVRVAEMGREPNGDPVRPAAARRAPKRGAGHAASGDAVKTPMGGTITAVNVAPGTAVEAGQVLVVIEAMKMENEIVAPRAGTVAEVRAAAGAAVQAGETLLTLA
jgi:biotin carboxyl carrier protein